MVLAICKENFYGAERHAYILGLREAIHLCCYSDPTQKLGNLPEIVDFAQYVEDQIDKCHKDKNQVVVVPPAIARAQISL